MITSDDIVKSLKRALKEKQMTYRHVATHLELTESSVKRLFSTGDFSLKRLEQICQLMDLDIGDLLSQVQQRRQRISTLTLEQETQLVSDIPLLLVAVCVLNQWSVRDMLEVYTFTEHELVRALARLDRIRLIELQPGNRVRLLISPDFSWIKGGPIQQFFEAQVQSDFFKARFSGKGEIRLFVSGMLSRGSNDQMKRRIERLAAGFRQLSEDDRVLPISERFGTSLILAMRPWELAAFEAMRRAPDRRQF